MKPLIVLLLAFLIALLAVGLVTGQWETVFAGNAAMSAMLLFTAMGHFLYTQGMVMMMPDFIPFRKPLVYVTGILEIAAAVGLLLPDFRPLTAVCLLVFFVLVLPANIHAAIKKVNYQQATYTGQGLEYLRFRVPLQVLFIGWVWYFSIFLK